jgi:hypothetical protein
MAVEVRKPREARRNEEAGEVCVASAVMRDIREVG